MEQMVTIHLRIRWRYCISTVSVGKAGQTDKTASDSVLLGCFCGVSWGKVPVSQHLKILSSLDPLRHSVLPVQYMYVKDGGHPVVVAKWQSTGGSSQRCPGFDSWRLPAFSLFLYFRLITCKFLQATIRTMVVLKPSTSLVDITCCLDM